MTFSLPADLQRFVRRQIVQGRFESHDEVICHALRISWQSEKEWSSQQRNLRRKVQRGIRDLDAGKYTTIRTERDQKELLARIMRDGRARLIKTFEKRLKVLRQEHDQLQKKMIKASPT